MEEGRWVESFHSLKKCYHVYIKHRQEACSERVAALLCFLHRKIELQVVVSEEQRTKQQQSGLKLS